MNSVDIPYPADPGFIWIRPTFVGMDGELALDASGRLGDPERDLTCFGWNNSQDTNYGLVLWNTRGGFATQPCDSELPVACCAPAQ
jgi:hypothetical protein